LKFIGPMATDKVFRHDFTQNRFFGRAFINGVSTTRVEVTTTGWMRRVGDLTLEDNRFGSMARVGLGYRRQEGLGIRMLGVDEQLFRPRTFDQFPNIHDGDPVADMFDDT
jgi:hypothetical protein